MAAAGVGVAAAAAGEAGAAGEAALACVAAAAGVGTVAAAAAGDGGTSGAGAIAGTECCSSGVAAMDDAVQTPPVAADDAHVRANTRQALSN